MKKLICSSKLSEKIEYNENNDGEVSYILLLIYVTLLFVAGVMNIIYKNYYVALIESLLMLLAVLSIILLKKEKKIEVVKYLTSGILFILILVLLIGGKGTTVMFIPLYPVALLMLLGRKKGLVLSIIYSVILFILGFYYMKISGLELSPEGIFNLVIVLLCAIGGTYYIELTKEKVIEKLRIASYKDQLTNLWNRKKFDEEIKEYFRDYKDNQKTFSLVLLDIDNFKNINDSYGHRCGDDVLVEVAKILERESREDTIISRWGGEEFAFILPHKNKENIRDYAYNLREKIEKEKFDIIGNLTVSIGYGAIDCGDFENTCEFFKAVDKALYKAKSNGKNQSRSIKDS